VVISLVAAILIIFLLKGVSFTGLVTAETDNPPSFSGLVAAETDNPPSWSARPTLFIINQGGSLTLDLRAYFTAPNASLTFLATETDNIKVDVDRHTLKITPIPDYLGEDELTLIASSVVNNTLRQKITIHVSAVKTPTKTLLPPDQVTFDLKDKDNQPLGLVSRQENPDGSLEITFSDQTQPTLQTAEVKPENKAELHKARALGPQIIAKFGELDVESILTDVFTVQDIEVENATITLRKKDNVSTILHCPEFNQNTFTCLFWTKTDIPFTDNGDTITFTVTSFSAYTGGDGVNLFVYDDTDNTQKYTNQLVNFYANLTNSTNATIQGSCKIQYNESTGYGNLTDMTFDNATSLYTHQKKPLALQELFTTIFHAQETHKPFLQKTILSSKVLA